MPLSSAATADLPASSVETSWTALRNLTDTMRAAAAREEWQQVVEMAVGRHRALLDHFDRFPVGPDNAEFYRDRLTEMLKGEQELQAIAVGARREVMRRSLVSRTSHRAVNAYLGDN